MSALSKILRKSSDRVHFWCPGCDGPHSIPVTGPRAWEYNGNPEAPTFKPSILVQGDSSPTCHSFVTDGCIAFLADSTHSLAGQTVPIPEWPENFGDGDHA